MTILITGANGGVSSALLSSLSGLTDTNLRALVRDKAKAPTLPNVETYVGDLDEPSSLVGAFAGVDVLWLLTAMGPAAPHASMNAVTAARNAGVEHVVRMSAVGAGYDAPTRNGRLHALSDAELQSSGINWTILRPHFFMQNLLGAVNGNTLFSHLGNGRLGMIDVRDIADSAAEVLTAPTAHAGQIYTLTGPESISMTQASEILSDVYGAAIGYQPVDPYDMYETFLSFGMSPWDSAVSVEYGIAYGRDWGDFTTTAVQELLGREPRTFGQFAADHVAAMRPGDDS